MSLHRTLRQNSASAFLSAILRRMAFGEVTESFQVLQDFENDLTLKLESLKPALLGTPGCEPKPESMLSLNWLSRALSLLVEKHAEAEAFLTDALDGKQIHEYLDDTGRILDACNEITARIFVVQHHVLLIRHAVSCLSEGNGFEGARTSLNEWFGSSELGLYEAVGSLADSLERMCSSLSIPKQKAAAKGEIFPYSWYNTHVLATLVCICFAIALSPSTDQRLASVKMQLSDQFLPSTSILNLLHLAKLEQNRNQNGSTSGSLCLAELVNVETCAKELCSALNNSRPGKISPPLTELVQNLKHQLGILTGRLDDVGNKIADYFHSLVSSRSLLLESI